MKMGLFSKQVALDLEINPNTLRRWCLELEKQGFDFERNENEQRIFYDRDLVALSEVKKLLGQRQSMEDATKAVAVRYKDKDNAQIMMGVIEEKSVSVTLSKTDLEELLDQAAARGADLALTKFNSVIEQRDRSLIHQLNESMEQKRLEIAAAVEEKQIENEKKNFILKWFGIEKRKKQIKNGK